MVNKNSGTLKSKIIASYAFIFIIFLVAFVSVFLSIFQFLINKQFLLIENDSKIISERAALLVSLYEDLSDGTVLTDSDNKYVRDDLIAEFLSKKLEEEFVEYKIYFDANIGGSLHHPHSIIFGTDNTTLFKVKEELDMSFDFSYKTIEVVKDISFMVFFIIAFLSALFLGVSISFPFLVYFSDLIIKPIRVASNTAKYIAKGNYNVEIENNAQYELGDLIDSLNYMTKEFNKSSTEKNEMLAFVGHELRSPIGRIRCYAELLEDIKDIPEEDRDNYYEDIIKEADLLNNMITEIIGIYKLDSGNEVFYKEQSEMRAFFDSLKRDLSVMKNFEGMEFSFDIEKGVIADIDAAKVKRVFLNLYENSMKAQAKKIKTTLRKADGDFAEVTIVDNGIGIKDENIDKVFDKFYTNGKLGGFGLGLSICQVIIREHGGKIGFVKNQGGAKVLITLPIIVGITGI